MIGTKEANNESMIIIVAPITCDKNKELKLKFSEECIKLCSSKNRDMGIKLGLNHRKRKNIKQNDKQKLSLKKGDVQNMNIKKNCWFQKEYLKSWFEFLL